ncbi:hypothetical protein Tco_0683564, partial [Tanacetum coccineum]
VVPDAYTYPLFPRVPLSYQASACSLSIVHFLKFLENSFVVLKLLENSMEMLKIMENKLESKRILENKLESLKLQENQPVDGLSSHTAKEMTWHATRKCTKPGKMQHPVDGRAWKDFDTKYLDFAAELRNVRLGLAADGFNSFGNLSQSYSMWPMILTTYNLPPWLCIKESSFMLTLLISGPKSPGKDINVYLRPLIDDLKDL